ncbi:TPA: hypothetical protein HA278_00045 [Candidatus Woesearchaeota archaeon]|nr:hypothetical protein [Candidatus Woesearchaeota archaeon]
MLPLHVTLKFYKRHDIQDAIIEHARDKEVGTRFGTGFGKRPSILVYPREVLELAKRGMTSLHISEEIWENPLAISSDMPRKELESLRKGWDLILDIDCAIFEYSRICASLVVQFLQYCGVKDISAKFSGNKGFHIAVPFEAFPSQVGETKIEEMFPDAARKIATYITKNIEEELAKQILACENNSLNTIIEKVNLPFEEIIKYEEKEGGKIPILQVEKFLEIDTILISSRHLYRMPYSLHEKSGLVSVPVDPTKVGEFEKHMARPEVVTTDVPFLSREVSGDSARRLLAQALDYDVMLQALREKEEEKKFQEVELTEAVPEELFPPCMRNMQKGMEDGKKRAIFCAMNFLGKIGWNKLQVEKYLRDWNKTNPDPLREVYLRGQLHSFTPGAKLPPNCSNEGYYKDLGICTPDGICRGIKNPVNYTLRRWKQFEFQREQEEKQAKREEKKKEREQQQEEKSAKIRQEREENAKKKEEVQTEPEVSSTES